MRAGMTLPRGRADRGLTTKLCRWQCLELDETAMTGAMGGLNEPPVVPFSRRARTSVASRGLRREHWMGWGRASAARDESLHVAMCRSTISSGNDLHDGIRVGSSVTCVDDVMRTWTLYVVRRPLQKFSCLCPSCLAIVLFFALSRKSEYILCGQYCNSSSRRHVIGLHRQHCFGN